VAAEEGGETVDMENVMLIDGTHNLGHIWGTRTNQVLADRQADTGKEFLETACRYRGASDGVKAG